MREYWRCRAAAYAHICTWPTSRCCSCSSSILARLLILLASASRLLSRAAYQGPRKRPNLVPPFSVYCPSTNLSGPSLV